MKKLFFTAIALVAFSSVSMANTIADESVVVPLTNSIFQNNIENKSNKMVFKALTFCELVGLIVANDYFIETGDAAGATRAGRGAQYACMAGF